MVYHLKMMFDDGGNVKVVMMLAPPMLDEIEYI